MKLDYIGLAETYKPQQVKTLLIGEAPPPDGKRYFYKIPDKCSISKDIEIDRSLPSTIFNHYFGRRPSDPDEYRQFLEMLKNEGVFLIDIYEKPEKFNRHKENWYILFTDHNLELLRRRVRSLANEKTKIIFLLARNYPTEQKSKLTTMFSAARYVRWIDFRTTPLACPFTIEGE